MSEVEATKLLACLYANLCSFVLDYLARQKIGGTHLLWLVKQLPIVRPDTTAGRPMVHDRDTSGYWFLPRVLELAFTAWDLAPFAHDCGYDGPPFRWDDARRFLLRCELDAAFFHLYGVNRDDTDYIMETFPVVKKKDIQQHGTYRTKLTILEIYDAMQQAIETGESYQSYSIPLRLIPALPTH